MRKEEKEDKMLEDIRKNNDNNNKSILLVTDNIRGYQQQFNNYNINNYKIIFVNWNDVLTFFTNRDSDTKRKNLELIVLDISTAAEEDEMINQISAITITTVEELKIFYDKRIFFYFTISIYEREIIILGISKQEDIRIQPFSVFDLIDLISTTKKKEMLDRIQLHDHSMNAYSSTDDKIKDAIKFLKKGIENNETTLLLLSRDIDLFDFKSQMALDHNIDINKLQNDGLLMIAYTEKFYLSFNQKDNNKKNMVTVDNDKVHRNFFNLADQVRKKKGIKGLRIFAMLDCFFEYGLVDELVDYERKTQFKFSKPILGICAYNDKHKHNYQKIKSEKTSIIS